MKLLKIRLITGHAYGTVMLIILIVFSLKLSAGELKTGVATVKITPPLGTPMAGYYSDRGAEKVHDDLLAKALVLEKDGSKIAIISCDLQRLP